MTRSKQATVKVVIQVERFASGISRYEARPVRMTVHGEDILFQAEDFIAYGRFRRSARKRCLEKVLAYLQEQAKIRES